MIYYIVYHSKNEVKMKRQKSKLYPTQIKYLQNNPIVSCHISKEKKEELIKLASTSNKSLSQLMADILSKSIREEKKQRFGERIRNFFNF